MVKKETIRQEDPLACRKVEKRTASGNSALADGRALEAAEGRGRLRMGLKTKREGVIIPFGDLMKEATRRAASVLFP